MRIHVELWNNEEGNKWYAVMTLTNSRGKHFKDRYESHCYEEITRLLKERRDELRRKKVWR